MPTLHTYRLSVRPLELSDLDAVVALQRDIGWADPEASEQQLRDGRARWLNHTVNSYTELDALSQFPYGDRAVVTREGGKWLGLVGLVPSFDAFGQLPSFGGTAKCARTPEVGLFWAISPDEQGKGYATEAARAVADFAFDQLQVARLVATTEHDNTASIAVMRKLGMQIERNPYPEPTHLQTVGVLERAAERAQLRH
jgi:RimJ/RimL family protein N-acetyltransferase